MAKAFMKKANPKAALVVDSLNLAFRWKHSGAKEFSDDMIGTIKSLANSYDCGKVIITSDWGSSKWRKEKFPEYKGNREELRANQTEQEKKNFEDFIQEYEMTLADIERRTNWPVLRYRKIEADDIAAYIVKHHHEYGIEDIWLISTDRDWDLLLADDVHRFSYITRKESSLAGWADKYDFDHADYITFKALDGDKGDNIPGVPGVGPVRATSLINEYGNVFDIYDALPIPGKSKYILNLNDSAEQLLLNVELMDLLTYCDEVLEEHTSDIDAKVMEYMNE